MRIKSVILLTMLFVCFGFSQLWAGAETEKNAVSAAWTWLSMIDDGNYSGSWNEASAYFRGAVTEQNWAASLDGVRKPLSKPISQKIVKAQESHALP